MKTDFLVPMLGSLVLCGCTSVYTVQVPLASNEAVFEDAPHVTIEDKRPAADLETHVGKLFGPCARHYGDDTYLPPKLVYLEKLIADRVPADQPVRVRLDKFDTIEYCENSASRAGAAAAYGASSASGTPVYMPASTRPGGDSMQMRIAGEINGEPFEVSRGFDYEQMPYGFTQMPSANETYRETLRKQLAEMADEIVAKLR